MFLLLLMLVLMLLFYYLIDFEVVVYSNYNKREVIAKCLTELQDYFNIDNWQINQPIILSDIYSTLDQVNGVQTVKKVEIVNKTGEELGYSRYSYDFCCLHITAAKTIQNNS